MINGKQAIKMPEINTNILKIQKLPQTVHGTIRHLWRLRKSRKEDTRL